MKKKLFICTALILLMFAKGYAQTCSGNFGYQYAGVNQTMNFQDSSTTDIVSPQTDYINWDFGDGSTGTGPTITHHFIGPLSRWVKREVKYSEIGNPANFCIKLDSLLIDPFYTGYCPSHFKVHATWLTGLTYGISSYYYGCPLFIYELVVLDSVHPITVGSGALPTPGIFTSNSFFFTYTLPSAANYNILQHFETDEATSGLYANVCSILRDSIPVTPAGCHASFFMIPDTSNVNNWTLYNYSTGSSSSTYFWDFGDGTTSTLPTPTHTYAITGNYNVCLTVTDGTCSDTYCDSAFFDPGEIGAGLRSLNVVASTVGISEKTQQNNVTLFPNPAENELTVSFAGQQNIEKITVSVIDMMGRELLTKQFSGQTDKINLDISEFDSGIYVLKVMEGKNSVTKRFVKK